ncbi:MAG: hypothetical protein Q8Q08_04345 [Candidatus Omnitrophota bacterium]|nr:hypothetical protein [Candidatus Omnitrophota bacterium]MDZ4242930.1 hypothetical protein [Candidatus Omnitrophota bacterium]
MEIIDSVPKEKLVAFSGEHLYYEISMLYGVSQSLIRGTTHLHIYNAMLESFVIHASVIIDFFYKPQSGPEDAKAVHFMSDVKEWRAVLPPIDKDFRDFQKKRNRHVVHLSYDRLNVRPEDKKWGSPKLTRKIRRIVDLFLEYADPDRVHPRLYELRSAPAAR